MPIFPARERDSSPVRHRLAAVEWPVPSTEPDTSDVDGSWFADGPRHSFIAYKGTRYSSAPLARGHSRAPAVSGAAYELAYDLCDSPHAWVALVDLPGVAEEHLSLTLGSQALHLKVSVPAGDEPRVGVPAGDYEVRIDAPVSTNFGADAPDAIDASLQNGLLRIRIPKSPGEHSARRVAIVSND